MHGNFDVVDIACFYVFFAQTRQSRPGEVTWKPKSALGSNFAKARMALEQVCSLDCFSPSERIFTQAKEFSLKRMGFSLKLDFHPR